MGDGVKVVRLAATSQALLNWHNRVSCAGSAEWPPLHFGHPGHAYIGIIISYNPWSDSRFPAAVCCRLNIVSKPCQCNLDDIRTDFHHRYPGLLHRLPPCPRRVFDDGNCVAAYPKIGYCQNILYIALNYTSYINFKFAESSGVKPVDIRPILFLLCFCPNLTFS